MLGVGRWSTKPTDEPYNFSWVDQNKLAAMGYPNERRNLEYLVGKGIRHLVTLSAEMLPPIDGILDLEWTLIEVEEFEAPSLDSIKKFIDICEENLAANHAVGVHCRQGLGRTGVMVACYLVKFKLLNPDKAILEVRKQRRWSIETYSQERAIHSYYDFLRGTQTK